MNGLKKSPLVVITTFCILLLTGCAFTVTLPEGDRLADVHEAFPDGASMVPPPDKRKAYERAILQAPYAVVYRAALESASENMHVISSDKRQGVILASSERSSGRRESGLSDGPMVIRHFFAIRLSEKGPKRIELLIMAKAQATCTYTNPTGPANVMAAGTLTPFMLDNKRYCTAVSQIHWAGEADGVVGKPNLWSLPSQKPLLGRLVGSVRAKIIKAGYE